MPRMMWTSLGLHASILGAGAAAILVGATNAASAAPVTVARATAIPACTQFVDGSAAAGGGGSAANPHKTITAAVAAAPEGAIICVAEGVYAEQIAPGEKGFTLAGGFQRGKGFKVRDSAAFVSKAQGKGGSFVRIVDPGPMGSQLTAIDGFEITGYAQAIVRQHWVSQRFDITNNFFHDNVCADLTLWGAGFTVNNVSGAIRGNVFQKNTCGRGGAGAINDETNQNAVVIENNVFDENSGAEPSSAHGGALHIGANKLTIRGNLFTRNSVTQWGGGLYIGAYTQGNQLTTATMTGNVYRANRAGDSGGGFFCDDGATCVAEHEVYEGNCGGNVLVDGGSEGSGPTTAKFDHITVVGALSPDCKAPSAGFWLDTWDAYAADTYTITNAVFWGNGPGKDVRATCGQNPERCKKLKLSVESSMLDAKPGEGVTITYGAKNLQPADPQFVDAKAGDFRLKPGSPAAGKGAVVEPSGPLGARQVAAAPSAAPVPPPATAPAPAAAPAAEPAPTEAQTTPAAPPAPTADAAAPKAGQADPGTKQAFEDAKTLGTEEAWNAFIKNYPAGFYTDLARAYRAKLVAGAAAASETKPTAPVALPTAPAATAPPSAPAPAVQPAAPVAVTPAPAASVAAPAATPRAATRRPALTRGAKFFGFPEKFNRYYTDPSWTPLKTLYVSPAGGGDGATRETPMAAKDAIAAAKPGTKVHFIRGAYQACFEIGKEGGGTYDAPIVLYAERNEDQSIGVQMTCCATGRQTCFNLERADYVAVDGFEMIGGRYGVRAVGEDYPASKHSRGVAALNCVGHDQNNDPFFTGQSDWFVIEGTTSYGAKTGDGHGIYISNGSDWNIVRNNETYDNTRSDFQINADPASTCKDVGVPFDDPRCDAYAGTGEGGQGASDYFLVENNHFHHGKTNGPNFTSVRRSVVRNNIFGPQGRHNVTFWQETDNPKLGSSENRILHNIFLTTGRHGVKFEANSTRNEFANNILIGVTATGAANPSALLMEVDDTVGANQYRSNFYVSGKLEGRTPGAQETARPDFDPAWFTKFSIGMSHDPNDFRPTATAPFLNMGARSADAPVDRNGAARGAKVDAGPIELP